MPYANLKPKFIDHILFMVKNVRKTNEFYMKILGKPIHRDKYSVAWKIGDTKVFFALPFKTLKRNTFDRNRIGLNHLAFGVRTVRDLKRWEKKIANTGIQHSGIIKDRYKTREYIWFDDPDGIRQEFYLRYKNEK